MEQKKRRTFTPKEDVKLYNLVLIHGDKWDLIASEMEGRNPRQCRERYRSFLAPHLINGPWSREEDELLIRLHQKFGSKWSLITRYFLGRSDCNVKNRWSQLSRLPTVSNVSNSMYISQSVSNNSFQNQTQTNFNSSNSSIFTQPPQKTSQMYPNLINFDSQNIETPEDEFQLTFQDTIDGLNSPSKDIYF